MHTQHTPKVEGYTWPAEWVEHRATWLAWPHNRESWPGKFEVVPSAFARFVQTLSQFEPVHILAGGDDVMALAQTHVGDFNNVILHPVPTNDAWIRDFGPTFLRGPHGAEPALVHWRYNAWGGKYPPWEEDNAAPERIAAITSRRRFSSDLVLEGGAIEGNGEGLVLTTPNCLLDPRRNPGASREKVENILTEFLSAEKVLWLEGGAIAGDDTDGHIDQIARFVNPTTIVASLESDSTDENYTPLQTAFQNLRQMNNEHGDRFEVIPLPMPRPKFFRGQRLPASYANFYVANGVVIVPQFEDPADEQALDILDTCFPDRQVIGLPALDLVLGLGAFHCLSQQEV